MNKLNVIGNLLLLPSLFNIGYIVAMENDYFNYDRSYLSNQFRGQIFNPNKQEVKPINCSICFDETEDFFQLSCGHSFCHDCLTGMIRIARKEKSKKDLKCAFPRCKRTISDNDLNGMLFAGKLVVELNKTIAEKNREDEIARKAPKKIDIRPSNLLSEFWIWGYTKKCPGCKTHIQKNEGCNHITCRNCTHEFCWKCLDPWSRNHYQCAKNGLKKTLRTFVVVGGSALIYNKLKTKKSSITAPSDSAAKSKNSSNWIFRKLSSCKENTKNLFRNIKRRFSKLFEKNNKSEKSIILQ